MTISFILNGEDVTARTGADTRLIDVLRRDFALFGAKAGCLCGRCGACSALFNGSLVKSCLIPAFRVHGGEVVTIEGFSQNVEYEDIVSGFEQAGVETCGYCETGKILAVEDLLSRNPQPSRAEILRGFQGLKCRCTEPEALAAAVAVIADRRRRRLYGRSV
jgi:carbon-monoxide dehydrogenase small subunit